MLPMVAQSWAAIPRALLAPDHRGAADVPIDLAGDRLDRRSRETY
jgi:hypothetical protein